MSVAQDAATVAALTQDPKLAQLARARLDAAVAAEQEKPMRTLEDDSATEEPTRVDPRYVTTERIGTKIRDAAVDPRPGDYRAPRKLDPNGSDHPHSPNVVAG